MSLFHFLKARDCGREERLELSTLMCLGFRDITTLQEEMDLLTPSSTLLSSLLLSS
jgi:hypothetical protein